MVYIDGFIAAVPTNRKNAYVDYAHKAAELFKRLGAETVMESWGDDVPEGKLTSFPLAVNKKDEETVVFSWIIWPSKTVRDRAWEKMMSDDSMKIGEMPFDGKRMIYGGFETIVDE